MDQTKEDRGSLSGAYKIGCFIVVLAAIALGLYVIFGLLYGG